MVKKANFKTKSGKNNYLKDGFQKLLVAVFVQRRLSAIISPFILKEKNHPYFFRISH